VDLTSAGQWREASDTWAHLLSRLRSATGLASLFDMAVETPLEAVAPELFNDS